MSEFSGWQGIFRKLLSDQLWLTGTPAQKILMVTCILRANFEPNEWIFKGEKVTVNTGQFVTSLDDLQKNMGKGISIRNIRTALYNLEKYRFLANISTKTGRLITVVNYSKYQVMIKQGDKDTDKQVTKTRQRGDKEVTIEKNYKNNKNINKKKILVRKDPTFRQECDDILTLWNDQEIEKDIPSVDTDLKRQMNIALMNYKVGKIIEAINNYSTSLKDDTYYYSHHWSLLKFLKVNKAMPEWFDDGINWINYTNRKELEKKKEPFAKPTTPYKKEEL